MQVHKDAQPGLDRRGVGSEVRAVQRVAHFQAERVARAEAAGLDGKRRALAEDVVPRFHRAPGRAEDLEAILAGVAGAGDVVVLPVDLDREDSIARGSRILAAEKGVEKLRRLRPLHGEPGVVFAVVFKLHAGIEVRLHPREVLVDFRRIDHQQVARVGDAIDDQVVDHAAVVVEQKGVLALAHGEPVEVVRQQPVQPCRRARAFGKKLAHVRDVEHPEIAAHRVVLGDDPAVLHRHRPPAEIHHFRPESDVFGVEWRLFECRYGGHGAAG